MAYFNYFDGIKPNEVLNYDGLVQLFASQLTEEELKNNDLDILHSVDQFEKDFINKFIGQLIHNRFKVEKYMGGSYRELIFSGKDFFI